MKLRTLFLVTATSILFACGGSDSPSSSSPSPDEGDGSGPVVDLQSANDDGNYTVSVVSDTEFDRNGGVCGDGTGSLTITNGVIEGTAMSTNGVPYTIGGQLDDEGEVVGGAFAINGTGAASYTGMFENGAGSGD